MAVNNTIKKVTRDGNDAAFDFSFSPMAINKAADLKVYLKEASSALPVLLTEGSGPSNYQVVVGSYPGTGKVVYPADQVTPLPSGDSLTMARQLELKQEQVINNQGNYFPKVIEATFDISRQIDLQQQDEIDRSIKVDITDQSGADFTLPAPVAGRTLGVWNSTGDGIELGPTASDIANAQSYANSAAVDADDAETARIAAEAAAADAATTLANALIKTNNLSELTDPDAALDNLGIDGVSQKIQAGDLDPNIELGGPSLGARSLFRYNLESMTQDETLWENNVTATVTNGTNVVNLGTDDGFADNDRVNMLTDGTMPSGIDTIQTYYVVNATTSTLQLSLTKGGSAISFTTDGTGTHTLYRPVKAAHFGDLSTEEFDLIVPDGSDLVVI